MADLFLPLKGIYFEQIKAGTKTEEYRLCTKYWAARLVGRTYDRIVLTRGYPAKADSKNRLVLPWRGFTRKRINHPHFGSDDVDVYAIRVCLVGDDRAR